MNKSMSEEKYDDFKNIEGFAKRAITIASTPLNKRGGLQNVVVYGTIASRKQNGVGTDYEFSFKFHEKVRCHLRVFARYNLKIKVPYSQQFDPYSYISDVLKSIEKEVHELEPKLKSEGVRGNLLTIDSTIKAVFH